MHQKICILENEILWLKKLFDYFDDVNVVYIFIFALQLWQNSFEFMIELPKNANGKVDRVALKKSVEGVKESNHEKYITSFQK